jgi:hypothetical protein
MNSIKKDPVRVRPLQLKIWVSAEEKKRIEKRAEKFQSTAEYLRQIALKGKIVERPPSITLNHYLELNRIGNNINQLTRQVNSGEASIFHKRTKKEIEEALTELTGLLRANTEALKELLK